MLKKVTARAIREYEIRTVTAHMWEANEEARAWYEKMGLKEVSYDEKYYRRLKPEGAYLLEKTVGVGDLLYVEQNDGEG
jgi:ribosomal protein S18 acetylase RimI-like enzyme